MNIKVGATYRHVKRGSTYRVLGRAKMQIGWETMWRSQVVHAPELVADQLEKMSFVVYGCVEDLTLWVRPETEFCDGRFVEVE
jgi:hypothetical protein